MTSILYVPPITNELVDAYLFLKRRDIVMDREDARNLLSENRDLAARVYAEMMRRGGLPAKRLKLVSEDLYRKHTLSREQARAIENTPPHLLNRPGGG